MRSECGARARTDTVRSRAASGIMLAGITTGPRGASAGLGQAGAGNARVRTRGLRPPVGAAVPGQTSRHVPGGDDPGLDGYRAAVPAYREASPPGGTTVVDDQKPPPGAHGASRNPTQREILARQMRRSRWRGLWRVFALDPNRDYEAERLAEAERQRQVYQSRDDPRGKIAKAVEQSGGRSVEKTIPVAERTVENGRFSLGDLVVLISCALFAEPFCHAAAAEFLAGHFDKAALGFTIGLPPGFAGGTFHWWKKWIGKTAQQAAIPIAVTMGIVGAMLAFAYIAGPDIYRRATAPATPATPNLPVIQTSPTVARQQGFGFAEAQQPPPKYPSKNYSQEERQKLLGLIGSISALFNERGLPAAQTAHALGGMPWTSEAGLAETISKAEEVRKSLDLIQNKIWQDIVPKNAAIYGADLNYIIDTKAKFDQFSRATDQFTGQVINFQRNLPSLSQDQRNWIAGLIQQGGGELWWRTGQEFETWIKQCISRMDSERDGLK